MDKGWDDSTEELVTEIFMLAGDASRTLSEMHYRIAVLRSKVRPETFLKLVNAIPLPNTDLTVIQRSEPEVGLNVDEERIQDRMPRPVKLDGMDEDTKLLGALVHWVMRNNLLTIINKYPAKQASRDFNVSYGKLRRVITGVKQHGGSYYERQRREQEGEERGRKRKAVNPVDAALAKKKKVMLSADTVECKYCGKVYHTGKKLTDHINQEHSGEQTIFACPFCTQPFNQYSEYLQHLGEHKDRVRRCRLCNKEFKTITRLRVHTKTHVNQCPFCSENFLTPQALQDHVKENHEADPGAVERQCSLCKFTSDSISKLAEHNPSVHRPYGCNICFLCFSAEYKLEDHRLAKHEISSLGTSVDVGNQGDQPSELPEPRDIGTPQQGPSRGKGDQPSKLPTPLKEPSSKEPKVPTGSKDPQVEVDEVKGSEIQTGEYDRECEACNHFFSSNMYRRSHITRYHKALLRRCKMCRRSFMFPWDFDRHLDLLHSKCKVCQQYLVNEEMLLDHMDLKHPTVAPEPAVTESQVTEDPATLEADRQDHQVMCKYCDRHFKNIAERNMHVNRRHKKVMCPQCEKCFVKQEDCDNHVRDTHKSACTTCGEVFASNPDLCKHTQLHHVKICHLCHRFFVSEDKLCDHMYEAHLGQTERTREELIEEEQARACAVQKWFSVMQKKKKKYKDDDEDEDDDDTYHPSQDYNDDSQVDPEFRPTKRELKEADREGDS